VTAKQYRQLLDAVYSSNLQLWLVGLFISVQLSGFDSWESIWLTAGLGFGLIAQTVRNVRASA